jgi:alpha-galactosidase
MYPSYYWRHDEPEDRRGMREIQYIMGLYQFWDDLLERYPNLLIDNCASGGRRIDFEMSRRSVVLFRSDVAFRNPDATQCMTHALSHWLPYHGLGTVSSRPYEFRSGLGNVFVVAANVNAGCRRGSQMNRLLSQYRDIRDIFAGDYYPLLPYHLGDEECIAWQFDRPATGDGLIQVFRRDECELDRLPVKLRGLSEDSEYKVIDLDQPELPTQLTGRQLMNDGFIIPLPSKPYAALFRYHKIVNPIDTASSP